MNSVNSNLAWFLHDLLSLADRGFVFGLINTYMNTLYSKQQNILTQLSHHENYSTLSGLKVIIKGFNNFYIIVPKLLCLLFIIFFISFIQFY